MTLPRRAQISLASTPYYHVIARCVRRAFLCGQDSYSGKNFDHRKQWVLERIAAQSDVFAINVCAYAVMSNHYHLVLHVDSASARRWSDDEVIHRWTRLFRGPTLVQRYIAGDPLNPAQQSTVADIADVWRKRLTDLSWYMRCINEFIARQANKEDECTGRFWEGRFKSQALLDHAALIACMAYVDLNPVRAGVSKTLDASDFTSVQHRIIEKGEGEIDRSDNRAAVPLLEFSRPNAGNHSLPVSWPAYLSLVEATGRQKRPGKRGFLSTQDAKTLTQLGLTENRWRSLLTGLYTANLGAIGNLELLNAYQRATGRRQTSGTRLLKLVYSGVP